MQKYIFGKASLKNLVLGMLLLLSTVGLILFVYGYLSGMASSGGDIILKRDGVSGLFAALLGILFLGVWGGYEIGRYVEMEFSKRRT